MKFSFCLFLLCFSLGLTSCYDALNAAYLQSNPTSGASSDSSQGQATGYQTRDTVYLKDGSIIHGFIVEEDPGVSLRIKTKSGNTFTYQMADVAKITHAAQAAGDDNSGGNGAAVNGDRAQ